MSPVTFEASREFNRRSQGESKRVIEGQVTATELTVDIPRQMSRDPGQILANIVIHYQDVGSAKLYSKIEQILAVSYGFGSSEKLNSLNNREEHRIWKGVALPI